MFGVTAIGAFDDHLCVNFNLVKAFGGRGRFWWNLIQFVQFEVGQILLEIIRSITKKIDLNFLKTQRDKTSASLLPSSSFSRANYPTPISMATTSTQTKTNSFSPSPPFQASLKWTRGNKNHSLISYPTNSIPQHTTNAMARRAFRWNRWLENNFIMHERLRSEKWRLLQAHCSGNSVFIGHKAPTESLQGNTDCKWAGPAGHSVVGAEPLHRREPTENAEYFFASLLCISFHF
jgi:hypothetical protein